MTPAETSALLAMVRMRWPHSNIDADPRALHRMWHLELADYDGREVEAAVRKVGRGREHAPTLDVILAELDANREGDAPSFEDAMATLSRYSWCLPYTSSGVNPPDDLVVALDALDRAGAPEIVSRLVAAIGVYGLRMLPDGSRYPLDPNERAQRRDAAQTYRHGVMPEWQADPTRGLALAKAVKRLGPVPDDRRIRPPRRRPALPAPEPVAPDDEIVGPDAVRELLTAQRREREEYQRQQREHLEAQREREAEEMAAAEAELVERVRRRELAK